MPDLTLMQIYVLASAVLAVRFLFVAAAVPAARKKAGVVSLAEDAAFGPGIRVDPRDADSVERLRRIHANALENEIPFFVFGWLLVGAAPPFALGAALIGVFVAARLLHTLFFFRGVQPWRSRVFGLGWAALLGIIGTTVWAVL